MEKEDLQAHVQYDDWKGTLAADNADILGLEGSLRESKLLKDREFVLAFDIFAGERGFFYGYAHVATLPPGDEGVPGLIRSTRGAIPTRRIKLEMSLAQFFKYFKRFSMKLGWRGASVGLEMEYDETRDTEYHERTKTQE